MTDLLSIQDIEEPTILPALRVSKSHYSSTESVAKEGKNSSNPAFDIKKKSSTTFDPSPYNYAQDHGRMAIL